MRGATFGRLTQYSYARFKKLDYHSTECVYSPTAYRGYARALIKDLETARDFARAAGVPLPITTAVSEQNRWLVAQGFGDADNVALIGYYDAALLPRPSAD